MAFSHRCSRPGAVRVEATWSLQGKGHHIDRRCGHNFFVRDFDTTRVHIRGTKQAWALPRICHLILRVDQLAHFHIVQVTRRQWSRFRMQVVKDRACATFLTPT